MSRGVTFLFRLLGAVVGAITAGLLALIGARTLPFLPATLLFILAVALLGAVIGWFLIVPPLRLAHAKLVRATAPQIGAVAIALLFGALVAALLTGPLALLPPPLGQLLPLTVAAAVLYLSVSAIEQRSDDLAAFVKHLRPRPQMTVIADDNLPPRRKILLDTSVIIDGRITDISKTGFLTATLVVPNFILTELQHIADSADPIRRKRGRRGLEVLNVLRSDIPIPFEVEDLDVTEVRDVDSKLVALARNIACPIMTNDYNLNRVAGLQGVTVLNINDLANAVKAAYLPGEELDVRVIQEGRESNQGVGYLEDGTMVVIEEGRRYIGDMLGVHVTKVLQTSAGRMIFAKIA